MGDQLKAFRLAELENWRIRAFNMGSPLGHVFLKMFGVINTVVRDGVGNKQSVSYALASLSQEVELAQSRDKDHNDPVSSVIYALAENMKVMMDSIMEDRRAPTDTRSNASSDGSLPHLHTSLDEPENSEVVPLEDAPCSSAQAQARDEVMNSNLRRARHHATALRRKRAHSGENSAAPSAKSSRRETPSTPASTEAATDTATATAATTLATTTPTTTTRAGADLRHAAGASTTARTPAAVPTPPVLLHMCDVCDACFYTTKELKVHAFHHTAVSCIICKQQVDPNQMNAHQAKYHGSRDADCNENEEEGEGGDNEPSPTTAATDQEDPTVAAASSAAAPLAAGDPSSTTADTVACVECGKTFRNSRGLKRHQHIHDVVQCPLCDKEVMMTRLDAHLQKHEDKGDLSA